MYERSYGYRYQELGDHPSAAQIAKAVRGDIKQAVSEGLLPAHWSYSVTSETFAGGQSVNVDVRDCADAWQECDGSVPGSKRDHGNGVSTATACGNFWCKAAYPDKAGAEYHQVLTEEARVAKMTLERIHGAYNHDGSEIQVDYFDVRYWGVVSFEDDSSAAFRKREKERLAAKKAARETGTVVGRVSNWKRDGSKVTHLLVETGEGKQVLGCGARIWRGSLLGKAADDAALTCSRCAARAGEAVAA